MARILVVDDEHDVRQSVENLLSLLPGSRIEGAGTFAQGRAMAQQRWDLVISDFALPDGSGVDILAAAASSNPGVPRVLMTAYEDHPEVRSARRSPDLTAFVQKPFEPESFLDRMGRLLGRRLA